MDLLWMDWKFALRQLRAHPGFTVISAAILALGIGANTAIFSMINTLLLRPFPFDEPDRLVYVWERTAEFDRMSVSYPNFVDWRDQNHVFEHMTAHRLETFNLTGTDQPERLTATQVSASLFPLLGVETFLGRPFLSEEDRPGAERVAVLSHRLWQRRFGADVDVLGTSLHLDGESYTVIGVMPEDFLYPLDSPDVELYLPIGVFSDRWSERSNHLIDVVARLAPGISLDRAREDMLTIAGGLEEQYPESNSGHSVNLWSLPELRVQGLRPALMLLAGAVGLVLLIACANVASLLLARAIGRSQEMAVRAALGAGRGRIIRQLLAETVLLSLLGGCLGLLIALWGVHLISASIPASAPPMLRHFDIDGSVLGFTFLLSVLTGLMFGLVPALQVSKPNLTASLKEVGKAHSPGSQRQRLQDVLVMGEVALALVLLIAAALLMSSFLAVISEDPGFDPRNVLTMRMALPEAKYGKESEVADFYQRLDEKLRTLPAVRSVGMASPLFEGWQDVFVVEGQSVPEIGRKNWTEVAIVNPDYFRAMKIPLLGGRFFTERDHAGSPGVAIVDRRFADVHFPGEDPIGQRIKRGPDPSADVPWLEIVGVVETVRKYGEFFDFNTRVQIYQPHRQLPGRFMNLLVRTDSEPEALSMVIRSEVQNLDFDQPVFDIRTMEDYLVDRLQPRRVSFVLLTVFAGVALLLAAVGIYGLMSYTVSQRTHEVGIRVALGAESKDVLRLILARGIGLSLLGIGIGLAFAFLLTPLMEGMIYGVRPRDPMLFGGLALFMALVASAATLHPASRATRVTPVEALRHE